MRNEVLVHASLERVNTKQLNSKLQSQNCSWKKNYLIYRFHYICRSVIIVIFRAAHKRENNRTKEGKKIFKTNEIFISIRAKVPFNVRYYLSFVMLVFFLHTHNSTQEEVSLYLLNVVEIKDLLRLFE